MKSAAIFLILSLAVVAVMSKPQDSADAHPDPCQIKPILGAKCGASANFGECVSCIVKNCYEQAMADEANCDAHKKCINDAVCA